MKGISVPLKSFVKRAFNNHSRYVVSLSKIKLKRFRAIDVWTRCRHFHIHRLPFFFLFGWFHGCVAARVTFATVSFYFGLRVRGSHFWNGWNLFHSAGIKFLVQVAGLLPAFFLFRSAAFKESFVPSVSCNALSKTTLVAQLNTGCWLCDFFTLKQWHMRTLLKVIIDTAMAAKPLLMVHCRRVSKPPWSASHQKRRISFLPSFLRMATAPVSCSLTWKTLSTCGHFRTLLSGLECKGGVLPGDECRGFAKGLQSIGKEELVLEQ